MLTKPILRFSTFFVVSVVSAWAQLNIVHLGDSYSAGNGARDKDGHRSYVGPHGCHRSDSNWGSQYVDFLRNGYGVTYVNRACSGARITHLTRPRELQRKFGRCPRTSKWADDEFYEQESLLRCTHYVKSQIEAVDNTTSLVLMTAGINDAGFAQLVSRCFLALAPRDAHRCQEQIEMAYNQGPSITNDLKEAIKTLFSRMGGTGKVVLFHYPYIVADIPEFLTDKNRHFDTTMGPLVVDAAHGVRNAVKFSNEAVTSAVEEANTELEVDDFAIVYKDIPLLFAGHEAHPGFLEVNKEG